MRSITVLLIVAAIAAGVYFGRDRLAPYLPNSVAAMLVPAEAKPSKADGGKAQGTGGHGGRGVTVATATATSGSMPVVREAMGTIVPISSTSLSSLMSGIVAQVLVKDGADVNAGDLLVQLDDRTIQANIQRDTAALARDQATLDDAHSKLKRVQTLTTAGAQTQQQFEDAATAAKQAEAAVAVDQASLAADRVQLTQTQIRAPFAGKLGVVELSQGGYAAPGANIVTLTQMEPVYAEFTLPEPDLDLVRSALSSGTLSVDITPTLAAPGAKTTSGPVVFIDNTIDTASGTFKLRARLDNTGRFLWPGQSVSVSVHAGDRDGLTIVPTVAVQPHGDGSICYVVGDDKTVQLRKVEVALNSGEMTGLAGGLKEGDVVVTEGQAGLTDGAHVTIAPDPKSADGHKAGKGEAGKGEAGKGEAAAAQTEAAR